MKTIDTGCGKNAELLNAEVGNTELPHCFGGSNCTTQLKSTTVCALLSPRNMRLGRRRHFVEKRQRRETVIKSVIPTRKSERPST
jgi:hypothetical protein